MEVDVCGPLLGIPLLIMDYRGFEDPHGYFSSLDGYFLLGNPENIRAYSAAICSDEFSWVLSKFLDRHLVRV